MSETQNQAQQIADDLVNSAGGSLANAVFTENFEGETFTAMRQKAAELLVKIDLIASSLDTSGLYAASMENCNNILETSLPYNQKSKNNLMERSVGDAETDPENVTGKYVLGPPQKEIVAFITADGKEHSADSNVAIIQQLADTITEQYDYHVNNYKDRMQRTQDAYTALSEQVDLYDRGLKQAWKPGEYGEYSTPPTISKSFLNSQNFKGKLQPSDFEPIADRLEGTSMKVPYTNHETDNGNPEFTSAYSYLNEVDERTRMTYEQHEEAKEKEYITNEGAVRYAQPYIAPDGREMDSNGNPYSPQN